MSETEINGMYMGAKDAPLNPTRSIETVTGEITALKQTAQRTVLCYVAEIGKRLIEAKAMLKHGEWMDWLRDRAQFSQTTANRMMQIYTEYGDAILGDEGKLIALNNLSVSNALRLIAIPAEEREEFAEENDVERLSARELDELIKKRTEELEKEAKAAREELLQAEEGQALAIAEKEDAINALTGQLATARERIREMGNAPVPVAVERDEEAIAAAVREARATATEEIDRVRAAEAAARAELEKQKKETDKQLAELGEIKEAQLREMENVNRLLAEEKERARAEIARAKTSGGSVAAFKVAFEAAQADFARMVEQYKQVQEEDPETAEKLGKAIAAMIGKLAADAGVEDA